MFLILGIFIQVEIRTVGPSVAAAVEVALNVASEMVMIF